MGYDSNHLGITLANAGITPLHVLSQEVSKNCVIFFKFIFKKIILFRILAVEKKVVERNEILGQIILNMRQWQKYAFYTGVLL